LAIMAFFSISSMPHPFWPHRLSMCSFLPMECSFLCFLIYISPPGHPLWYPLQSQDTQVSPS
jgi:hypothetical protein